MRLIERKTSIKADPKNLEICQWYQYTVLYPLSSIQDTWPFLYRTTALKCSSQTLYYTYISSAFQCAPFWSEEDIFEVQLYVIIDARHILQGDETLCGIGAVQLQIFTTLSHLCFHWRWLNLVLCVVKRLFTRQLIGQCWEMLMLIGSLLTCNMF